METKFSPEMLIQLIDEGIAELRTIKPSSFVLVFRDLMDIDALKQMYAGFNNDWISEEEFVIKSLIAYLDEVRGELGKKLN